MLCKILLLIWIIHKKTNNYCLEDYDPNNEIIDEFKDSQKKVEDFKNALLNSQGFGNIDSFYNGLLYAIRYQLKNKKKMSV